MESQNICQAFEAKPFSDHASEHFFYLFPALRQRLFTLTHMARQTDGPVLVVGDHGGGKTTLLKHFISSAEDDWRVADIPCTPGITEQSLIGRPVNESQAVCREIVRISNTGIRVIFAFDDAHYLDGSCIEAILRLRQRVRDEGNDFGVLFFTEPQIKATFATPSIQELTKGWTYKIHMPRLSLQDTEAYVNHRLTAAQASKSKFFTHAQLIEIYKNSQGLPLRINECAVKQLNRNKRKPALSRMRFLGRQR